MSEVPQNFTSEDLPPEPGTVGDPELGVQGDFDDVAEESNSEADVEVNSDEAEEDDD